MNYAAYVKENMPLNCEGIEIILWLYRKFSFYSPGSYNFPLKYHLDIYNKAAYLLLHTLCVEIHFVQTRSQSGPPQSPRRPQSTPRARTSPHVPGRFFLRSTRPGASQIRDAAASTGRGYLQGQGSDTVRGLPPHLLSVRGSLRPRRPCWAAASPAGPQRRAQTRWDGDVLHRGLFERAWTNRSTPVSPDHPGGVWAEHPSSQHRARPGAEKKTTDAAGLVALPPQAIETYEALRTQVLGGGRCRTGFTAFLYHGMARGLTLIAVKPLTPASQQEMPESVIPVMASDSALVRLLANMVLHIQSEVQHVY